VPVEVVVVTQVLASVNHCVHCQVFFDESGVGEQVHMTDVNSYPDDIRHQYQAFSDMVMRLAARYGPDIRIKIVDALSLEGVWLALRRGARRYPTWLVGDRKVVGLDEQAVCEVIQQALQDRQRTAIAG